MKDNILKVIDIFLKEVDWKNATEDYSEELKEIQDSITDGNITEEQAQRLYEVTDFIIAEGHDVNELIADEFEDYTLTDFMNNLVEIANPEQIKQKETELKRITAEIKETDELVQEFINDENELNNIKIYIKKKISDHHNSTTDKGKTWELREQLVKIDNYSVEEINKFINDNKYDKDDLCIEVLNKQIKDLESSLINEQDVKLEVTKENKDIIIEKLKNNLNAQSNKTIVVENSLEEEKIKELLEKLESDLTIEELNKIVDEVSYNNSFVLDVYEEELQKLETEIEKLESESNVSDNEDIEINENDEILLNDLKEELEKIENAKENKDTVDRQIKNLKSQLNKLDNDDIRRKNIKELLDKLAMEMSEIENLESKEDIVKKQINVIEERIKNIKDKNNNNSKNKLKSLKARKEKLEEKINSLNSISNDEIKQKIKDKETLRDRFIKNKENKVIVNAYSTIMNDIIEDLKDDEEFYNLNYNNKIVTVHKRITEHKDYEKIIKNEKLVNELMKEIVSYLLSYKFMNDRYKKVKSDKKAWYKSMAFWGGAALGGVLGFTVQPGNIGAIVAVGRIGYSIAKKAIKSYAEEHEGEDTKGMRIINRARDFKEGFKEKHPGIANGVKKINDFLKKPSTQLFLNGMAIGYTVGHIGRNVANMFNNPAHDGTNMANNDNRVERPNGPTPGDSDTARTRMAEYVKNEMNNNNKIMSTSTTSTPKISKGQIWNVAGMNDGYGYDSSTMDKLVHLDQKLGESVKIMNTRTVNGVKMVLVNDTATNESYGWFKAKDILEKAVRLKK